MSDLTTVFDKWRQQFLNERLLLKPGPNGWDLYSKLVAQAYADAPDYDAAAAPLFKSLSPFVEKMFKQIQSRVSVEFVEEDPYKEDEE